MSILFPLANRTAGILAAILFFLTQTGYAQGDDPCSATLTNPVDGATCTPQYYSLAGMTSTSSALAPNPTCAGFDPGITPDGWLKFTISTLKNIVITTTAGSIYDGGMELYRQSGGSCSTLTSVLCDDDGDPGPGFMPAMNLLNVAPGTYYLRYWDFEDTPGDMYICIAATDTGDDPCSAKNITPVTGTGCTPQYYSLAGLTSTASTLASNPTCAGFDPGITPDGWLKFTTTAPQDIFITSTAGSIYDGGMELYRQNGSDCTSLTSIICDDDSDPGPGFMPQISLGNMPAGTYYVRFWDFENTQGDLNICVATIKPPPVNDECNQAISISNAQGQFVNPGTQYSGLATESLEAVSCNGKTSNTARDVWYSFQTDANGGNIAITVTPVGNVDVVVEGFYIAGNCIGPYACADANSGGAETLQMNNLTLQGPGEAENAAVYNFRVYRYNSSTPFSFNISVTGTALPLELRSFTGTAEATANVLNWETSSERNVQFHIVERSADGLHWLEAGRRSGQVYSTSLTKYTVEDRLPPASAYYRLRSLDLGGQEHLSNSILLTRKDASFRILRLFPAPASDLVTLQFQTVQEEILHLQILDMTGRILRSETVEAGRDIQEMTLSVQDLQSGMYMVTLQNSVGISRMFRFVKA